MNAVDPTEPTVKSGSPAGDGPELGQRLARYRLTARLGHGGMGVVFAAHDPELDREVAIKVVHDELLGIANQERLRREARAMARVSHPNVVPVYEVGEHAGRTYYTMERIQGVSLSRWLESRRTRAEILRVFCDAGRGLAALHAAGIVHRDIKAANILVGNDGRARVADLGIAAASSEAAAIGGTLHDTTTLRHAGTPAFMAPEQLRGEIGDAASDQFALGVTLYRSFAMVSPFDGETIDERLAAIAAGPRASPRLPRTIEAIARRAMAAEPAMRFPDVTAFVDAVAATRQPRRTTIAAISVVGIAGVALATWLATRPGTASPCQGAAAQLAGSWDPPTRSAVITAFGALGLSYARATADVVARDLDTYAASWVEAHIQTCRATHVRHEQSEAVLAARMACLDQRRASLRDVTTALAHPTGAMLEQARGLVSTLPSIADCAAVTEQPADASLEARLAAARAQLAVGDDVTSRRIANEVVIDATARHDGATAAAALLLRGRSELDADQAVAAVQSLSAAAADGHDPNVQMDAWLYLSNALQGVGQSAEALRVLELAEAALARHPEPLRELRALAVRGTWLGRAGRYGEARAVFMRALAMEPGIYGEDSPMLAATQANLATVARRLGKPDDAVAHAREALRLTLQLGDGHPDVAKARHALGVAYSDNADYVKAQQELAAALAVYRAIRADRLAAIVEEDLASVLSRSSQMAEAIPHYLAAIEALDRLDSPRQAMNARANLAGTYLGLGRPNDAEPLLRTALAHQERTLGAEHVDTAQTQEGLARVALELHHLDDAEHAIAAALMGYERAFGSEHRLIADVIELRAELARLRRQFAAARDDDTRALALRERLLPAAAPPIIESLTALAEDHAGLREWPAAVAAAERASVLAERSPTPVIGRIRLAQVRALIGSGDRARAQEVLVAAAKDVRIDGDTQARLDEIAASLR